MLSAGGHAGQTDTAAQRRLRGQDHGAAHAVIAAHQQAATEVAFVGVEGTLGNALALLVQGQHRTGAAGRRKGRPRHREIVGPARAGVLRAASGIQPAFGGDKAERPGGAHGLGGHGAGIRVHAGGHIQSQHGRGAGIHRGNRLAVRRPGRAANARAEHGVDHDAARFERRGLETARRNPGAASACGGPLRIVRARRAIDQVDANGNPPPLREHRQQQAVAAVVAGPAQHLEQFGPGHALQQTLERRARRAGHQQRSGQAVLLNSAAIHGAALLGGVQEARFVWRRHAGRRSGRMGRLRACMHRLYGGRRRRAAT